MSAEGRVTPEDVPSRRLDTRVRRFGGALVLARGDKAFELTESAAFVFTSINGISTVRALAARLTEEYDIGAAEAMADLVDFLNWLLSEDLLEFQRGDADPAVPVIGCDE